MPPVGFEPPISAGERPQTHALDRAATGTGRRTTLCVENHTFFPRTYTLFKNTAVSFLWKNLMAAVRRAEKLEVGNLSLSCQRRLEKIEGMKI